MLQRRRRHLEAPRATQATVRPAGPDQRPGQATNLCQTLVHPSPSGYTLSAATPRGPHQLTFPLALHPSGLYPPPRRNTAHACPISEPLWKSAVLYGALNSTSVRSSTSFFTARGENPDRLPLEDVFTDLFTDAGPAGATPLAEPGAAPIDSGEAGHAGATPLADPAWMEKGTRKAAIGVPAPHQDAPPLKDIPMNPSRRPSAKSST